MVSANLKHNPYLLETEARFNGRTPKVNSAIERFEGRPLVEWVDEVPGTYRDEMNGLDFDLYFTGTESDYQKVIKAFIDQGINVCDASSGSTKISSHKGLASYDVRLIHADTLEDVDTKRHEIEELIEWLNLHRNRRLNYDTFISAHSEELDGSVPYIIVNENPIQLELPFVSVETVDSARSDLVGTELTNTPILFMVNPSNSVQVRSDLLYVLQRPDIEQGQLFFCIHPSMNRERAVRVISDLGVEEPQVVETPDSQKVVQYLNDYPSMKYVRRSVSIFQATDDEVSEALERAGAESAVTNANRIEQIAKLDKEIRNFKDARLRVGAVDPLEIDLTIAQYCQQFENSVRSWRNKKTGVTGLEQIWKAAGEFDFDLRGWVSTFEDAVKQAMESERTQIEDLLSSIYKDAGAVPSFTPKVNRLNFTGAVVIPNVIDALITQTETERVNPKNDFFNIFAKPESTGESIEYVEVAGYDVWRATVLRKMLPALQSAVRIWKQELSDYRSSLIEAYMQQLDALSKKLIRKKESVTAMLSDEERMLEEDKDWLQEFETQLHAIERN